MAPPAARTGGVANLSLDFGRTHPSLAHFYGDAEQASKAASPLTLALSPPLTIPHRIPNPHPHAHYTNIPNSNPNPNPNAEQVTDRVRPCGMGELFSCGGEEEEGYAHAASAHCEWLCPVLDAPLTLTLTLSLILTLTLTLTLTLKA